MPLYEIPLWERQIKCSRFPAWTACLHVDEVGVYVYGDDDNTPPLTTDFLRRCLTLRNPTRAFIEASTPEEAVQKFYQEYEGAQTGGEKPEAKALWINTEKPILELPNCDKLHKNRREEFICGTPIHNLPRHKLYGDKSVENNGEHGMCILEGYDNPSFHCPIKNYYHQLPLEIIRVREQTHFVLKPSFIKNGEDSCLQ